MLAPAPLNFLQIEGSVTGGVITAPIRYNGLLLLYPEVQIIWWGLVTWV
jgi:hypothetical protein